MEDDLKTGQPSTTRTDENITRVKQLVRSDRRLTVRMISDELSLNRESVQTILLHDLGMREVCAKMVLKILSEDQKQNRVKICEDVLEKIKDDPDILMLIIAGNEAWVFIYDPETKRQNMQWNTAEYPDPRRRATQSSKIVTKATNTTLHKSLKRNNGMTYDEEIATQ